VRNLIWIVAGGVFVIVVAAMTWARVRTGSAPSRITSRDGQTMMEIRSIGMADGHLVIKGTFLGAMPATTLIRPEEAWRALGLVGVRVILAMPAFLLTGWWRCVRPRTGAMQGDRPPVDLS
jgi:hypothetical protein